MHAILTRSTHLLVAACAATALAQPAGPPPRPSTMPAPTKAPARPAPAVTAPAPMPLPPPPPLRCMRPIYQGHASVARASGIAKAKVVALRWRQIEIQILDSVKGNVPTTVIARGGSCAEENVAVGDSVLIMTDSANQLLDSAGEGLIPLSDARVPSIVAFATATTPAARTKALVSAIVKHDAGSEAAATFLAGSGADLRAVTKQQRGELLRAVEKNPTRDLAIVLARLRVELDPSLYDRAGVKSDALARSVAAIHDYEKLADTLQLAEIIKNESDPVRQVAAYERCDRLQDHASSNLLFTLRGPAKYVSTSTRFMVSSCSRGRVTMASTTPTTAP